MRPSPLYNLKQGINRLRVKGGANPSSLYDLVNGWITVDGSIKPREGTIRAQQLDANTKGLMANDGTFNVFSIAQVAVPSGYLDNILINPNDATQTIKTIWFAKPFMGFPYVVAEFVNGDVFHYWLQNSGTWAAHTVYQTGTLILPTVSTGLAYLAQRVSAVNPTWQPETGIALNAIIEPTEYTGYQYKAVAVAGSSPHTGQSEPVWPIVSAGTIQEFGDFDTSATDAGTTQGTTASTAQPLSTTITDRYGDSSTIASAGASAGGTLTLPPTASTKVTTWKKGTLYAPGAVVQPSTSQGAFLNAIPNGDFENGNDGNWVLSAGVAYNNTNEYQGNECLQMTASHSNETATMSTFGLVTPGQKVVATAYVNPNNSGANLGMGITLRWYDASDSFLSNVNGPVQENGGYRLTSVTGIAPPGAAHCRVQIFAGNGTSAKTGYVDLVSWNLATPAAVSNFLFEAIQAAAGASGSVEPTWPTVAGNTVVDNAVTWKAIGTSIITWEAVPIMQSGASEPTWPTAVPNAVHDTSVFVDSNGVNIDTSISWIASSRQITDTKDPNTTAVALNSSHVFAVDKDIVPFSAAVDPTDWSSANNAGYLPTGLNNYGDNPAAVLTLYRSNLMVMNAGGYQMWQTDPDPANMALLDAQPVGSIYTRGAQSVANDLLFVTEVGVRNLATVGATANMQVGSSGQPVDPIVLAQLKAGVYAPLSLYYPGKGQYMLFFGPQAFVFTVNGQGLRTWSRYIFPDTITDWTLNGGVLYLRTAGNLVWQFDPSTLVDDLHLIDAATALLLHFDGGNGQISTVDSSSFQNPVQMIGTLSTAAELFGASSLAVNGANKYGSYLVSVPFALGSELDIFAGPSWTIEGAFNVTAFAGSSSFYFISYAGQIDISSRAGFQIYITQVSGATCIINVVDVGVFGTVNTISFQTTINTGTWYTLAVVNNAGTTTLYLNGVAVGPTQTVWIPTSYIPQANSVIQIGSDVLANVPTPSGFIDEVRVSNIARYTGNYTPAVSAFVLNQNTPTFTEFKGVIQTPYVDSGPLGLDKELAGIDIVGDGSLTVQIGWAQNDKTTFNDDPGFSTSLNVTPPFAVSAADTVPGEPIPFPMTAPSFTVIFTFDGNQVWEWNAANLYLSDVTGTATG